MQCRNKLQAMAVWLECMRHPDGEISFFNDAATKIARSPAEILSMAAMLLGTPRTMPTGLRHHTSSGYVSINHTNYYAVVDVGEIGPDYQPGHAHADTLSFELSIGHQRILVNSGTSQYGASEERNRQRQTPAHNTVSVGGLSSSEVWSSFRVARRARPFDLKVSPSEPTQIVCSHDGYHRLNPAVTHTRSWSFSKHEIRIVDQLSNSSDAAQAHFHLHPNCAASLTGNAIEVCVNGESKCQISFSGGRAHLIESGYNSEFGLSLPTTSILVDLYEPILTTIIRL